MRDLSKRDLSKPFGLFAIDPGTTTGVAYCPEPIELIGSVKEIFGRHKLVVDHMQCPLADDGTNELAGALEIADLFLGLRNDWIKRYKIPGQNIFFIYEDFILRPGKNHSSDRSGLSPVRIVAHIQGALSNKSVNYLPQQPALAKGSFTNERLRRFGLWTVGKEHGRDATRHLALAVRLLRA